MTLILPSTILRLVYVYAQSKLAVVYKQEAHQLLGHGKRCASQIRPKAVGAAFSVVFRTSVNAKWKKLVMSYPADL